jgi:hypothetical protein
MRKQDKVFPSEKGEGGGEGRGRVIPLHGRKAGCRATGYRAAGYEEQYMNVQKL